MSQHHQQRRERPVAGQQEADDEQEHHLDFLGEHVERVGHHALEHPPARFDGRHYAGQTRPRQHDGGGGFGYVSGVFNGHTRLGLAQRGRVVHTVAAHAHHRALSLKGADELEFVFGKNARKHAVLQRATAEVAMQVGWRTHLRWNTHLLGDGAGGERVVARHHHDAHAGVVDRLDDRAGIVAHRVFEADQAGEPQFASSPVATPSTRWPRAASSCSCGSHADSGTPQSWAMTAGAPLV